MRRTTLVSAALLTIPGIASAQVLASVAGLFNIIAGLMLVAAFLCFFGGGIMWFTRLGTANTYRDDAIKLMQWGVVILFALSILLFLMRFIQEHAAAAAFVAGIVIVCVALFVIVKASAAAGGGDEH